MKMNVERFVAMTAMIALSNACTIQETQTEADGGGGAAGSGGTAGTGGTGGTGGSDDSGTGDASADTGVDAEVDASTDATEEPDAAACLGDLAPADASTPDAGVEGMCLVLPSAGTTCGGDPDAGIEGTLTLIPSLCGYLQVNARAGVFDAFYACIAAITPADACGDALQSCVDAVLPQACVYTPDGGTSECARIAAACPAVDGGSAGITESQCEHTLNAFTPDARTTITQCWDDRLEAGSTDCAADFSACVFPL